VIAAAVFSTVLVLSLGIAALVREPEFPLPERDILPESPASSDILLEYSAPEFADSGKRLSSDETLDLPPAPATLNYSTYTVRSGDTIGGIAKKFGRSIDTIISVNGVENAQALRSGTVLRIPSIDGLVHRVRSGDTVGSIAKQYKIDTTRLVDANDLGSSTLIPGQSLFIPGARLPEAQLKQALGRLIVWPLRGRISSYYGYREDPFTGVRRFHAGLDIVADSGTPVHAAAAGTISDVGYNANFGNYVIMTHAGGYQTLYGHLSSSSVAKGAKVGQGATIGLSGNTGYSTGPHLHFGLFKGGVVINPLKYLK
jgi:murein DD-endopeptidase MepM/ murein hydrolase activator NlpD